MALVSQTLRPRLQYQSLPPAKTMLLTFPQRFFPRGIYREQQLDKKKRDEGGMKVKPLDFAKNHRMNQATSMDEVRQIRQDDANYSKFVQE